MIAIFTPELGSQIVVSQLDGTEIGRGTFLKLCPNPDGNITVYECNEGSIVVDGEHIVDVGGRKYSVSAPASSQMRS